MMAAMTITKTRMPAATPTGSNPVGNPVPMSSIHTVPYCMMDHRK